MLSLLIGMIKHSQGTQSNKFVISFQYLKKEVRDVVHFLHAGKQSFYKLPSWFLVEVARHVQSTQNRKLVMFLQYIKKKCNNCFCVLFWCKTFRYFTVVMFIVTCYCWLCTLIFQSRSIAHHRHFKNPAKDLKLFSQKALS